MTAHKFARQLLLGPDLPIFVPAVAQYDDADESAKMPFVTKIRGERTDTDESCDMLMISDEDRATGKTIRLPESVSPGSELRPGYKIAFNSFGGVTRWRILKIQKGLALVTEGWGCQKILSIDTIAAAPYIVEQTELPWYLRPFYRQNAMRG